MQQQSPEDRARAFQARLSGMSGAPSAAPSRTSNASSGGTSRPASVQANHYYSQAPPVTTINTTANSYLSSTYTATADQPLPPRVSPQPTANFGSSPFAPVPAPAAPVDTSSLLSKLYTAQSGLKSVFEEAELALSSASARLDAKEHELNNAWKERTELNDRCSQLQQRVFDVEQRASEAEQSKGPFTLTKMTIEKAREVLKVGTGDDGQTILEKYKQLLSTEPAGRVKELNGAFYVLAIAEQGPADLKTQLETLSTIEMHSYFDSIPFPRSTFNSDAVDELSREKVKLNKIDAKLSSTKRELEAKIAEVASLRTKVEHLENTPKEPLSKKATVLAADLEKSREDMKQLQQRLNDANQKLAKEEKETKKLTERTTKWEEERTAMLAAKKEADATLESLKKQLEDEKAKPSSAIVPRSLSVTPSATGSDKQSQFVIQKLVATNKQLSEELANKTAENAELMMMLCGGT